MKTSIAAVLAATLVVALGAAAAPAGAGQATTRIVRGTPAAVEQVPWQVSIFDRTMSETCGGSILDATHILTAAHCATIAENSGTPRPAGELEVWAGTSSATTTAATTSAPTTP
jgi:secreted trypsin-like serine protease